MGNIRLEELVGEASSFYLKIPDKHFHLRPFTVGDSLWIQRAFGDGVSIENMSIDKLCRIAFQLMELEDKKFFIAKDVKFINEEGVEMVKRIGGPELMFWQITGITEQMDLFKAIVKSISGSKILEDAVAEEKKSQESNPLTGPNSSTSSRMSTDGQQSKSSRVRSKKSTTATKQLRSARG